MPQAPKRPVRTAARPTRQSPPAPPKPLDMSKIKVAMGYRDITDIQPYDYNARDNAKAIAAVANSIKAFGFLIPVVVDKDGVLAAGHTRVEAAKTLGMLEVPTIEAEHLTPEQINAFRLIDNKVAEIADWDNALLANEMQALEGLFDFTDYGWTQNEVDCLQSLAADDCLSTAGLAPEVETGSERGASTGRRAPTQARFTLGELVFFEDAATYRAWAQGLRELHNFDEQAIAEDLKRRLGILV